MNWPPLTHWITAARMDDIPSVAMNEFTRNLTMTMQFTPPMKSPTASVRKIASTGFMANSNWSHAAKMTPVPMVAPIDRSKVFAARGMMSDSAINDVIASLARIVRRRVDPEEGLRFEQTEQEDEARPDVEQAQILDSGEPEDFPQPGGGGTGRLRVGRRLAVRNGRSIPQEGRFRQ